MPLDLLSPHGSLTQLRENYVHQLDQTISAYLPSFIFVGEALQNAMDAVRVRKTGTKQIEVQLDFNHRRVTVRDNGDGFPDQPDLLFLGGGKKRTLKLAGMVGVGLKVILFSSDDFMIRARNSEKKIRVHLENACKFKDPSAPPIQIPDGDGLPEDAEDHFPSGTGTEISYRFPASTPDRDGVPEQYLRDVLEHCIRSGTPNYLSSLENAVARGGFPNRFAALIASDLRRYSYVGMTGKTDDLQGLTIKVSVSGSRDSFGLLADFADGKYEFAFEVTPSYLTVKDTLNWAKTPKPVIRNDDLGDGGTNITRQHSAFNVLTFECSEPGNFDDFKKLLVNARGTVSGELERFERLLFPKILSISLTLGRINDFNRYLPGGSRRVISSRGVITEHALDISSGRNQQYVRCFDIVVDVDSDLNYGKTHLTDTHLVANVRRFVNEAYLACVGNAARNLVGKIPEPDTTVVKFWSRENLDVPELSQVKVPYDENDVIALFFELAGRGKFNDFVWYGLSSVDAYDGRAIIVHGDEVECARLRNQPADTDLKIIEFKMRGASIARDFDREEKDPSKVNLIICYEVGTSPVAGFQVVDLADSKIHKEGFYIVEGVTHVLFDTSTGREVPILPLREYVTNAFPPGHPPTLPNSVEDVD